MKTRTNLTKTYDAYERGVHYAELTVYSDDDASTFQLRKKDFIHNNWSAFQGFTKASIAEDPNFKSREYVHTLLTLLDGTVGMDWASHQAVGWPDEYSIYVKQHELTEIVNGRKVTAHYWALKDGVDPIDLVISTNNVILATVDPYKDCCLVLRGYEDFTTLKLWSQPNVSQSSFGYRELGCQWVEMSDGVKLATLVYLPLDGTEGPYPVIFTRTPYGIGDPTRGIDNWWHYCTRGYAVVIQAVRGTAYWDPQYRSEGEFELGANESPDGADALAWIVQQSWCDGNIGMSGGSYLAHTQLTAATAQNPALKCIIPEVCFGTVFGDQPYIGGCLLTGMAFYVWWLTNLQLLPERTWTEVIHHRPLVELDRFATGKEGYVWRALVEHATYDDYWRHRDWYRPEHVIDVPALHISGWYDDDLPGTRRNWEMMQRNGSEHQRLIFTPGRHSTNRDRILNGFRFGLNAIRDDIWVTKQRWYDRFLKGVDNGVEEPVVQYYLLGKNEWWTDSQWPPLGVKGRQWYFHSNGQAHRLITDGTLSLDPPAINEPLDIFNYDPQTPVPNWTTFDHRTKWEDVQSFPYECRHIESRPDVVVYTSTPLVADLTIAGDIMAVLYASCDVRDTDWWVHLSDVDSEGRSTRIRIGGLRARFRNLEDKQHHVFGSNFEKEELLSGLMEDVVRFDISLLDVAMTFKKGHRLRIAVMNACNNYAFPNSNTGEHEGYVTETVVGRMAIHHSRKFPSHIILPVFEED